MPELRAFAESVDLSETLAFVEKNFMDEYAARAGDEGANSLDSSTDYNEAWAKHSAASGGTKASSPA